MARAPRRGRRNAPPQPPLTTRRIRSLKDARRVVRMYGARVGLRVEMVALYVGIRHAGSVDNILAAQIRAPWGWVLARGMDKLQRLVAVHRDLSIAAESLDILVRALTSAPALEAASPTPILLPLDSISMRLAALVIGDRTPFNFTEDTLRRARVLLDAGQALRHRQLGGATLHHQVRGLGELLVGLATVMVTGAPIPSALFDDYDAAAPVERPPPSKAQLLDYVRQAKRHLLDLWDARVSKPDFACV